jgi:small subunit ribosomal protein S5
MSRKVVKAPPRLPEVKIEKIEKKEKEEKPEEEFEERIVQIDRVAYVVAGGKRTRFRVVIVIGNKNGQVGVGISKAVEIPDAVAKAKNQARKRLIEVPIKNGTIPHEIKYKYGSAYVLLKPASPGTGIIAGGPIKAVIELAGITDILSKMLGSNNKINNVMATYEALKNLRG